MKAKVSSEKISLLYSRSQQKYKQFSYCLDDNVILWTAEPFVTKLSMKVHYCKPECLVKKLHCYFQENKSLYDALS